MPAAAETFAVDLHPRAFGPDMPPGLSVTLAPASTVILPWPICVRGTKATPLWLVWTALMPRIDNWLRPASEIRLSFRTIPLSQSVGSGRSLESVGRV